MPHSVADIERHRSDCQLAVDTLESVNGNYAEAARVIGCPAQTLRNRIEAAKRLKLTPSKGVKPGKTLKPIAGGRDGIFEMAAVPLPAKGRVRRYLLTSAQNNTRLNDAVWDGLQAFSRHVGAEILVGRYTYNKSAYRHYGGRQEKGGGPGDQFADIWYDERLDPYLKDSRVEIAPGLMWCGEVNIIPTAARPLSGFESYTGRASGVFPHAKIAMESIAAPKGTGAKFNYTTGTVTQRNYIACKAGQKAEFHHAYGALLVEVDHTGNWFCRQINADKSGTFYDLDVKVSGGKVTTGHRLEAITWGDVHVAQLDPLVRDLAWGEDGMLDTLRPRFQFFHDALDMRARNHHELKDPHLMFERHVRGQESVSAEVTDLAAFFRGASRKFCKSVAVESNHNEALVRWLKEHDWRKDPVNAEFYLAATLAVIQAIRRGDKNFKMLEWAVAHQGGAPGVAFLGRDESFITCKDFGGGIENGMHGDVGPNGAKPSPYGFANTGRKANIGHAHSAGIFDGVYRAGTSSLFDLGYNRGPSSWSHSHIVTYPNGKRAIVTMWNGKWRA